MSKDKIREKEGIETTEVDIPALKKAFLPCIREYFRVHGVKREEGSDE
jgi:hypothetical protein